MEFYFYVMLLGISNRELADDISEVKLLVELDMIVHSSLMILHSFSF